MGGAILGIMEVRTTCYWKHACGSWVQPHCGSVAVKAAVRACWSRDCTCAKPCPDLHPTTLNLAPLPLTRLVPCSHRGGAPAAALHQRGRGVRGAGEDPSGQGAARCLQSPADSHILACTHTHPRVLAMPRMLCLHRCSDGVGAPQALPLPGVTASPAPVAHTNSPHASTAPPYPAPVALNNSPPHPLAPPPAAGTRRHCGCQLRERHRAAHHAQDDRVCAACPAPSCQRMATHACSGGGDSWLCGDLPPVLLSNHLAQQQAHSLSLCAPPTSRPSCSSPPRPDCSPPRFSQCTRRAAPWWDTSPPTLTRSSACRSALAAWPLATHTSCHW